MVRLKVSSNLNTYHGSRNFNSTMVRLKACCGIGVNISIAAFQFHYGSVKSVGLLLHPHKYNLFQFHYGSVKRKSRNLSIRKWRYFNSTMVRLKAAPVYSCVYWGTSFQFHYGSVKSSNFIWDCCWLQQFQFHYGSVKSQRPSGL